MFIIVIVIILIIGISAFFINNHSTNMEPQTKTSAKDFFLNLGAIVALSVFVGNLISLLFTIINKAYPVTTGYNYYGSYSISFPVATLIIVFPIYILLIWLLERGYSVEPEKRGVGVRKWLTYITLFVAGIALAGDLIYVIYYFIDGLEMTMGFIMKALSVLVISFGIFFYYISDAFGRLNSTSRKVWAVVSALIIIFSIIWGFSVLGSPRTQRLIKYDEQKVNDLMNINSEITNYYATNGALPENLKDMSSYYLPQIDPQTQEAYEYQKTGDKTYNLCVEFNKAVDDSNQLSLQYKYGNSSWVHPAGKYCFNQTINPNTYYNGAPQKQVYLPD